jgi:hypothetical protein
MRRRHGEAAAGTAGRPGRRITKILARIFRETGRELSGIIRVVFGAGSVGQEGSSCGETVLLRIIVELRDKRPDMTQH